LLQATCDWPETRSTLVSTVFAAIRIGLTTENVRKKSGETTQSVKDVKTQDAMQNAGEARDEGKKLKNAVMGK
jgi:hypothetical protein